MDYNSLQELKKLSKGLSVLFLEKDKKLREQLERIFHKTFSSVYQFGDEIAALKSYSRIKTDIMVLGLPLVKRNAIEFIADIKQINPDAVIIVVSENNDDFELLHVVDFDIKRLILKPLALEQMVSSLCEVLENLQSSSRHSECFEFLENIYGKNKEVVLYNSYKGIPISSAGVIESVEPDGFTLRVQEIQQVAVKYESHTVLGVEGSSKFIHAYFLHQEMRQNILRFIKPRFIDFTQRNMDNKRLKVDKSFKLGLYYKNKNIEAFAEEISINTISIFVDDASFDIQKGEEISLTLGFEIDTAVISNSDKIFVKVFAKGEILRTEPYKSGFKVVSSLSVIKSDQSNFKKYIKHLEMEIIKEFKYLVRR